NQQRSQFSTTLSAPLGEWVTVAATGGDQAQAGVYSTRTAPARQQLIQVRVSAR
ncbi:MAG: hypothetical protein JWQ88_3859, partial [Rhodoferax sp.]|nr:hypothetical protein [Rhodoferax sp.]